MVMGSHFAFGLVDTNALSLDFVVVSVEKIVYYMNLAFVVVDFVYLVDFQEKFFYIECVVVFVYDTLACMVQKYLVNDHRQMIHNPYDEMFVVYFFILLEEWIIFTMILCRMLIRLKIY